MVQLVCTFLLSKQGFLETAMFIGDDPLTQETLIDIATKLQLKKHHPNIIGVQFVQIGTVPGAREHLRALARLGSQVGVCDLFACGGLS